MNILLLEDRGSRLYELKESLEDYGHTVYPCESIYRANETWNKYKNDIDCAIIDLAMQPDGLKNTDDSESGYYSGWVFLQENVFLDQNKPNFIESCLILSAWVDSFKQYLIAKGKSGSIGEDQILSKNDHDIDNKLFKALENIHKISNKKQGTENGV
jgi:hypothetical protein